MRSAWWMMALLTWGTGLAAGAPDHGLALALKQAVETHDSFDDRFHAQVWLADMSSRLARRIPDPFYRVELLKTVHAEATAAGLEAELVLAVIHVESAFDRFAISATGAQGLMQVMPFWKKEIGHPRDNLFRPQVNLRYGCTILKYYMDQEPNNVIAALARYNGSAGQMAFPRKVLRALRRHWQPN